MQFLFTPPRGLRRACAILMAAASFAGTPALAAPDIVLGQIGPFTVIPVPDAPEVNQGIKAYVNQANQAGIRGRKIAFFEADDRYSADGFMEQFAKALEKKPVALLSPIGSNALKRLLDDRTLNTADVVIMNAIPGAESLRSPGHPKLFHIRAGDKQQIKEPTAASLAASLRSIGELDFGGYRVDFSKGHVGSQFVDIAVIGSDGRLRY